jgi:hypothetical protein
MNTVPSEVAKVLNDPHDLLGDRGYIKISPFPYARADQTSQQTAPPGVPPLLSNGELSYIAG